MNKTINKENEKQKAIPSEEMKEIKAKQKPQDTRLIKSLIASTVGLLFARCHIIFGAFPLGIALVSVLPSYVLFASLGAVVGSLTMGSGGIIYAIVSAITVLLRIVTSIGAKDESGNAQKRFSEGILLRMSVAVISGFITAVYEVLLDGFSMDSILYSLSMILLPPMLVYAFSGLFDTGYTLHSLLMTKGEIFSIKGKTDKEIFNSVFFQCSSVLALFLLALSLKETVLLGISASYVFLFSVTLVLAKRFGPVRAMTAGFLASLGVSGTYAVSFALCGLASGFLFPFGVGYSILAGGVGSLGWGIFCDGMQGLLSLLPEFAISAAITAPLLRFINREQKEDEVSKSTQSAGDMVGVFALSYRNKFTGSLDSLEGSLASLSSVIRNYASGGRDVSEEDCITLVLDAVGDMCKNCSDSELCKKEDINPAKRNVAKLAEKLLRHEPILTDDINTYTEFCQTPSLVADEINMRFALLTENKYRASFIDSAIDQYDLIGKLVSDARTQDRLERSQDTVLSEKINSAMQKLGYSGSVAKVFGERRKHFIIAMEDDGGDQITSKEVREEIEKCADVRLATPEFYRKEKMALMEADIRRRFFVEFAIASSVREGEAVSGDTALCFESKDDRFFALCSDGMGSGEEAKRTSEFVGNFLLRALNFGGAREAELHLLNSTVRSRGRECSATVDLFELDLLDGNATFIKSGAAPSFVKRESSIFRIRSDTAPLGLLRTIDCEKIKVEVKGGDYIIMLSDGVSPSAEDSPWLLELLSKPAKDSCRSYADHLLTCAKEKTKSRDDMSVIVIKISYLN